MYITFFLCCFWIYIEHAGLFDLDVGACVFLIFFFSRLRLHIKYTQSQCMWTIYRHSHTVCFFLCPLSQRSLVFFNFLFMYNCRFSIESQSERWTHDYKKENITSYVLCALLIIYLISFNSTFTIPKTNSKQLSERAHSADEEKKRTKNKRNQQIRKTAIEQRQ